MSKNAQKISSPSRVSAPINVIAMQTARIAYSIRVAPSVFGISDFRDDLKKVTVPTLVLHGDVDGIVPLEGSGARTHKAIAHSELHVITGGPHGISITHVEEFNSALLDFLGKQSADTQPAQRKIS